MTTILVRQVLCPRGLWWCHRFDLLLRSFRINRQVHLTSFKQVNHTHRLVKCKCKTHLKRTMLNAVFFLFSLHVFGYSLQSKFSPHSLSPGLQNINFPCKANSLFANSKSSPVISASFKKVFICCLESKIMEASFYKFTLEKVCAFLLVLTRALVCLCM